MGLTGEIGGALGQTLEQILAQQLMAQQQAERERATRAQEGLAQSRMAQDASQHSDLMGLRGREMDQRQSQFDAETEQQSLDALRGDRDKMDARLTRLTKEDETQALLEEFANMPGLSDAQRAAARAAIGNGRGVDPADLVTEDERQKRRKEALGDEITLVRAREQAQRDFTEKPPPPPRDAQDAYTADRNTRTKDAAKSLLGKVSGWNTGMGSMLSAIPATDATNFAAELDTLKANIAFNELAQMRAASRTGGALGAVSEKEMRLLESALGAINPRQSPDQFKAQLTQIINSLDNFEAARGLASTPGNNATVTPPANSAPAGGKKFKILGVE